MSKAQRFDAYIYDSWHGPFSLSQLRDLIRRGVVTRDTLLRIDGAETVTAGRIRNLYPTQKAPTRYPEAGQDGSAGVKQKPKRSGGIGRAISGCLTTVFMIIAVIGFRSCIYQVATEAEHRAEKQKEDEMKKEAEDEAVKEGIRRALGPGLKNLNKIKNLNKNGETQPPGP